MIEYYPQIKAVHVATAVFSGGLFLLRGLLVLGGKPGVAMAAPVRYLSYANDTILLTAALMLVSVLPAAVFANGWLAAKLALLLPYIALGTFALKRARSARVRWICYVLALTAYGFMLGIARSHDPLGFMRAWLG